MAFAAQAQPDTSEIATAPTERAAIGTAASLAASLRVGDLVFIRVGARPFSDVAQATGSWTNHVGVVIDTSGADVTVAESALPWSRTGSLSRFVGRSERGRVAVLRLRTDLSPAQEEAVRKAALSRTGILYDTGFDLHSRRQFCSRFVREVLFEGTGQTVGDAERFSSLLADQPHADLGFWKLWYFGRIPWSRVTVTPAAVLRSPLLQPVFDGNVRITGS